MSEHQEKEQNKDSGGKKVEHGRRGNVRQGGRREHHEEITKKNPLDVPLLRFGGNNNFHKFREALSKSALKEYGHLGKLIELDKYYEPAIPKRADFNTLPDPDDNKMLYQEALKGYTRVKNDMLAQQPKLYGMICQYLSVESMDEVKHVKDYDKFSVDKDPEKLWAAIVSKHKVHSISKVTDVVKRSARKEYLQTRQGGYESLISYRERFDAALKAYADQLNLKMDEADIAMDFFDGLDNGRYAQFKTDIHNSMIVARSRN
jgi:hypothetical protein